MRKWPRAILATALVVAVAGSTGCVVRREPIPRSNETESQHEEVARSGAQRLNLELRMGAGRLELAGDEIGTSAVVADFTYSPPELQPRVESETSGDTLDVLVSHPEVGVLDFGGGRDLESDWVVAVANGLQTDLDVKLGAGEGELDLRGVDVRDLQVDTGAGRVVVDLTGERVEDVEGRIHTGAGEVSVKLPSDVGVRVHGFKDGIGEWNYEGFTVDGDYLVNDAYDESDTTIELDIQRGIGEVTLELVD